MPAERLATDRRFMAASIRLSLRHLGLTGSNPSVGALIVDAAGSIVGRGVTALGGRPHAERQALDEAGEQARGATAYVTLEPCAHHGQTPPCAEALIAAGIHRVVVGAADPDLRVAGRGCAMLRAAGIEVVEGVMADQAAEALAGYLTRSLRKQPHVTLKLALSRDDMIGRLGEGQMPITGPVARAQAQLLRAASDVILVGVATAIADDPLLTVRLPGLADRSPIRVILDKDVRLPPESALAQTAAQVPLRLAVGGSADPALRQALAALRVEFLPAELLNGRIALPRLLADIAAEGISTVMVEGGAATARAFLVDDLVDRIVLFRGGVEIGAGGIVSPVKWGDRPNGFTLARDSRYGNDLCREWVRG